MLTSTRLIAKRELKSRLRFELQRREAANRKLSKKLRIAAKMSQPPGEQISLYSMQMRHSTFSDSRVDYRVSILHIFNDSSNRSFRSFWCGVYCHQLEWESNTNSEKVIMFDVIG
jgi:hypothetical protein